MAGTHKKYDVLMTYGWCRVGYAVLRSLAKRNVKVLVMDDSSVGMCRLSRLKAGFRKYPSPYRNPEGYVQTVKDAFETSGARIIIAPHEESFPLVQNRKIFPPEALSHYHLWEIISRVNDKNKSAALALSLGIPVPRTVPYESVDDLENKIKDSGLNYPLVIKLRRSNSAKGVFYANSFAEIKSIFEKLISKYDIPKDRFPIVQEYVQGDGWGVSGVWQNGEPLALVTHKRLREKTFSGGTSTLRMTKSNPLLENYALKIMSHLKWQGTAMIEFKYDESTGQGWFIEINPRLWGSLQLGIHAGVDIPWTLYNLALGNPVKAPAQKDGVICKWLIGESIVALKHFAKLDFKKGINALTPESGMVFDDFFMDDPLVFLGEAGYYFEKFISSGFNANPEEKGMIG